MPPPLPRPKRVWVFCAVLAFLAFLNILAIFTTANSQSEIISSLYPLRASVFGIAGILYIASIIFLFRRDMRARITICIGVVLQFGYMLYYNGLLISRDWPPTQMVIIGNLIAFSIFLVPLAFIVWFPFSKKVSRYFKEPTE